MDVSRILTACTTLLAVSKECRKLLSEELDYLSMAGNPWPVFLICSPLQYALPRPIEESYMPCLNSGGGFLFCQFVALREYLRSLVRFAADSSFATAPNWCQHAATISHRYWKDDYIVAVWVETLRGT
jgi:hypothetical protein